MSFTLPVPLPSACLVISRSRRAGFTLLEVLASLTLFALIVSSSIWALSQMNSEAAINRIYTCAETIAQNEIDAFLSAQPYSPRHIADDGTAYPRTATPLLPVIGGQSVLAVGTTNTPITMGTNADGSITLYADPAVGGLLTIKSNKPSDTPPGFVRTVTDLALTQQTNGITDSLDCRGLSVTINYLFKGKLYTVSLSTVRTSDFEK